MNRIVAFCMVLIGITSHSLFAATYSQIITLTLGTSYTGLGSSGTAAVGYQVIDAGGTTQITRTTSGITEEVDAGSAAAGVYVAAITVSNAWTFPYRVHWDCTGKAGVVADSVFASDRQSQINDGYSATLATNLGTTNTRVSANTLIAASVTGAVGSVTGNVTVGAYASGQDPWTLWAAGTVDGSVDAKDVLAVLLAGQIGAVTNSYSAGTFTLTTPYKRQDGTTTAFTNTTVYATGTGAPPVQTRSGSIGTLP